ncbi:hypothetical protein [Neobacillus massiliamazoniensis]|uniref:hypothetical protein n=1 Tax=Neobacillus massiliamazoniensis TaxID=1499688 RepID=UPI00159EF2F6|nr:hypothetical protein [Neobacillus massiliamazoniensis]
MIQLQHHSIIFHLEKTDQSSTNFGWCQAPYPRFLSRHFSQEFKIQEQIGTVVPI